jgi:hypothetical protein
LKSFSQILRSGEEEKYQSFLRETTLTDILVAILKEFERVLPMTLSFRKKFGINREIVDRASGGIAGRRPEGSEK